MYWDTAATTKIKPEVLEAMMPYFTDKWYNPSSIYEPAREVRRDVERAREIVAKSINAEPEEIIFTSGGSEGNCFCYNTSGRIVMSNIEHTSMDTNYADVLLAADRQGLIYGSSIKYLSISPRFAEHPNIISVAYANNEIGTIQDIQSLANAARLGGFSFHTDAVQAYGKIPIDVKALHVDYLSASGHKIGAPKGIGFVYKRKDACDLTALITGTQEHGVRGGTENVPYIMGLAKAVELIDYSVQDYMKEMYEYLILSTADIAKPNGFPARRLYNIASLTFKDEIDGQALIGMLNDKGQYVSAGSACHAHSKEPSHVLKAIGLSDEEANRTIRISFLDDVTKKDIDELVRDIRECLMVLKGV